MANQLPGVEVSFSRTSDISLTAPNNRLLIAALVAPGAPCAIGTPFLATAADQVDVQAGDWSSLRADLGALERADAAKARNFRASWTAAIPVDG